MKNLIEEIKTEIKNHKSVTSSALKDVSKWKRAHYILLAEIISQEISQSKFLQGNRKFELGNTISYITLQRLFEDGHSESAVNDLRFLKSLHKLCIFLGYFDLNEYILCSNNVKTITNNEDYNKSFFNIIENLCTEEFKAIQTLPDYKIEKLYNYAFRESKTISRIKEYLEKYKASNYFFDFDYKEAAYELVTCSLVTDDEDLKVLKTMEHWDFILKNDEGKTSYYKVFNGQTYYLKKDKNGVWKIWDNYNPNFDRIITKYY